MPAKTPQAGLIISKHAVLKSSEAKNSLEALKLSDFGLSFILEGSRNPGTYAGTQEYKPPVSTPYHIICFYA